MIDRLVIASQNAGKLREFERLLPGVALDPLLDGAPAPEETGATYAENAAAKARAVAQATGLPALADDSGLEVDALEGAPGVRSARFAPSDGERIARLLAAMAGSRNRRARFRCVVVLAWPDGREEQAEGIVDGRIAAAAAGGGGFGYDPIFVADELGVTFAAAGAADKARVSHRARAMRWLGAKLGAPTLRGPGGPC
jgi:XTP/dITP diphosphohydrolase